MANISRKNESWMKIINTIPSQHNPIKLLCCQISQSSEPFTGLWVVQGKSPNSFCWELACASPDDLQLENKTYSILLGKPSFYCLPFFYFPFCSFFFPLFGGGCVFKCNRN